MTQNQVNILEHNVLIDVIVLLLKPSSQISKLYNTFFPQATDFRTIIFFCAGFFVSLSIILLLNHSMELECVWQT